MTQSQTEGPAAGNLPVALDQPVHTQNTQLLFAGTPGSAPAESKAYKGITWAQMAPTQTLPWSVHISTPAQQLFTKEQTKAYMSDTLHKSKQCAGGKMQFFMSRPPLIWGQTLEFPTFYSIEPDDPTQGGEKKQSFWQKWQSRGTFPEGFPHWLSCHADLQTQHCRNCGRERTLKS